MYGNISYIDTVQTVCTDCCLLLQCYVCFKNYTCTIAPNANFKMYNF